MTTPLPARAILERLTARPRQVAHCLVTGSTTNQAISDRMGINLQVVKNYMREVFDAFGMSDRVECALFIVRYPDMEQALREEFEVES